MFNTILVLVCVVLLIAVILGHPSWTRQRRKRLKEKPFPELWLATLIHSLAVYPHLSEAEQKRLQGHIQVFLAEKQFIGCGGLAITAEMEVIIAAMACLLLLNERETYFPKLQSVLVYPSAYWVNETVSQGRVIQKKRVARLGESWSRDQLILSWDQVQEDSQNWQDGKNVVLHEFAHQLDQEDGKAEGVPILAEAADYAAWARVMTREYEHLCNTVKQGAKSVLDSYGATNPAEFFAVATETFFEKPYALSQQHSDLYQQLKAFYKLDPIHWG